MNNYNYESSYAAMVNDFLRRSVRVFDSSDIDIVKLILLAGADVNVKDSIYQCNTLHLATLFGRTEAAIEFIKSGADVNARNVMGSTPLHWAVILGRVDIVIAIIKTKRADVNAKDMYGWTPLHWAARMGHAVITAILVRRAKADKKAEDKEGRIPLDLAKFHGHSSVTAELEPENNRRLHNRPVCG